MSDWTIRPLREDDEEALVRLLAETVVHWPAAEIDVSPLEHLRWKLRSDPLAYGCHTVAEVDGRLIGARFVRVVRARLRGETILVQVGMDNTVHPDFQARGLFREIRAFPLAHFKRTSDMNFGLRTKHPASKKIGDRIGQRLFGHPLQVLVAPLAAPQPVEPVSADWRLRTVTRFDERLEQFWKAASKPFDFAFQRRETFANWRYCDPRAGAFTVVLAERGDELLGSVVLRVSRRKGYIADLLVLPERDDVLRSLALDGLQRLREAGALVAECALAATHPYRQVLSAAGFRDGKRRIRPLYMGGRLAAEELAFLLDRKAAVHLVLGDFDLV